MDINYSTNQTPKPNNMDIANIITPNNTPPTHHFNDVKTKKDNNWPKRPLLTTSPEALRAANMVTPKRIANILEKNGPLAIRYINKELGKQVENFNKLSTSKQRRLIMHAMESGDKQEKIIFQKVSWGHWSVVKLSNHDVANFELIRDKVNLNNLENKFENISNVIKLKNDSSTTNKLIKSKNNNQINNNTNNIEKNGKKINKNITHSVPKITINKISNVKTTYLDEKAIDSESENDKENGSSGNNNIEENKLMDNDTNSNEVIHLGVRRHSTVLYSNYNRLSIGSQKLRSSSIPFILNNKHNNTNNNNYNINTVNTNMNNQLNDLSNKRRRHSNFISKDRSDLNQFKSIPLSYQSNVRSTLFNDLKKFSFAKDNSTNMEKTPSIYDQSRANSNMSPPISPITNKYILPPIQQRNSNDNRYNLINKTGIRLPSISDSLTFNTNKNNISNFTFLDNSVLNNNYTYRNSNDNNGLTFSDSEDSEDWSTLNKFEPSDNENFIRANLMAPINNESDLIKMANQDTNLKNEKYDNNITTGKHNKLPIIKSKNEKDIAALLMSLKS